MNFPDILERLNIDGKPTNKVASQLAQAIDKSGFLQPKTNLDYVTLHCIDHDIYKPTTQHLFLTFSGSKEIRLTGNSIQLKRDVCVTSGTFRNSFYIESWRQLTSIQQLFLRIRFRGTLRLRVYQVSLGVLPEVISSQRFDSHEIQTSRIPLPDIQDYPKNARLFWDIVCESDSAEIFDVAYETNNPARNEGRLVVLLRTFGRTQDICKLLDKFNNDANKSEYHDLFNRLYFILLDTSPNIDDYYANRTWPNLKTAVIKSANLGGGGNVSHLLYIMRCAFEELKAEPDDLLILDDDLELSTESLRRFASFCRYRTQEVVCSVPVLMKSEPTVMWEDGGYWGRLNPNEDMSGNQRSLFPTLLRHGWRLKGFDHLDEMASVNFCEYSTFIFFGLSYNLFKTLGYPTAFFLRGDDIEYSLRLNAAGYKLFTNPNLCAWHEPAHSYVQEYMAILHGITINLFYGADKLEYYIDFFEKRLREHGSVSDEIGLIVYTEILRTLTGETAVFQQDFQGHYLDKFKFFKQLEGNYKYLSPFIVDRIREKQGEIPPSSDRNAKPQGTLVVPFIHMGDRSDLKFQSVLMFNPHSLLYRQIDCEDLAHKRKMTQQKSEFYSLLAKFVENFETIVASWKAKMAHTQQEDFWIAINSKYQADSVLLSAGEGIDIVEEAIQQPQETIEEPTPEPEMPMQAASDAGNEFLPADFDPAGYLKLNPDVAEAGQNPIKHFLMYGRYEGRGWK
jgi:GT2 family glycosyltransferase